MADLTARESEVLNLIKTNPLASRPDMITRLLNWKRVCDWCPVATQIPGKKTRSVPRSSRQRVYRVLLSLMAKGRICRVYILSRKPDYVTRELFEEQERDAEAYRKRMEEQK